MNATLLLLQQVIDVVGVHYVQCIVDDLQKRLVPKLTLLGCHHRPGVSLEAPERCALSIELFPEF